jgi:hypothetical protein
METRNGNGPVFDNRATDRMVSQTRNLTGRSTVAGLFHDRGRAQQAIEELRAAGFSGDQIGVALRDRTQEGRLAEETGTRPTGNHAGEGAAVGLLGGGLLGGVLGYLVAIGSLAIPGIGPVVAGGALAASLGVAGTTALAGAGIGAAAGVLVGTLIGMGIPEEEARYYERGVRAGDTLVTVNAGQRALEALAILERNEADTGPGSVVPKTIVNR